MNNYEEQSLGYCNQCRTFCNIENRMTLVVSCLCGNLILDPTGVTTTKERELKSLDVNIKVPTKSAVKSDGGSSSYYKLSMLISNDKIEQICEGSNISKVSIETGDVIRAIVDNDFDLGNIIKACRRIHQAKLGTGKEGTDVEYDIKKIKYFLDEWYEAYAKEQM